MATSTHDQFSAGYRWYALFILTLGYIFNFVDRQVMTILLEPIKTEFGATDTQMGLLTGLAFCAVGAIAFARGSNPYAYAIQGGQSST